jgi:hypothetical protein
MTVKQYKFGLFGKSRIHIDLLPTQGSRDVPVCGTRYVQAYKSLFWAFMLYSFMQQTRFFRGQPGFLSLVLGLVLVSCLTTNPPITTVPTNLLISEIGTTYYSNSICWFEIYNPTANAIDLATYTLRARGVPTTGGNGSEQTWSLPTANVAPGEYLVIGGKVSADVYNTSKSVYVVNAGNVVPYWFSSGFVELLKAGNTADFVRWGNSTVVPTTSTAWAGANVPALPVGLSGGQPSDLGKSIVRGSTDTNTSNDWSARDFATPSAANDVPAGASDGDADGIPDSAEVSGGTFTGLDLYAMGARVGIRDVFIELDHMNSSDPGLNPQKAALDKMVTAFASKNIALHIDAGNAFALTFDPINYNLGNSKSVLPYSLSIGLSASDGRLSNVYELKSQNFEFSRNLIFHYMVMGSSQELDGTAGSSGYAEIAGNDGVVTFGGWGLNANTPTNTNILTNYQAATIMHEFGHNLGLNHGGFESENYKPNYLSIMNYLYTLRCLGPTTGANAADRYMQNLGFGTLALVNDETTTNCGMDYSDGSSSNLDENHLNENAGMGRGVALIDWNNNQTTETDLAFNINPNWNGAQTILSDYNDWANIILPFARQNSAYLNSSRTRAFRAIFPISNDQQASIQDEKPSATFFKQLRERLK